MSKQDSSAYFVFVHWKIKIFITFFKKNDAVLNLDKNSLGRL